MANIGVPKERRPFEFRVGMPPDGVSTFVEQGHTVYVERGAGTIAGFKDDDYAAAGRGLSTTRKRSSVGPTCC